MVTGTNTAKWSQWWQSPVLTSQDAFAPTGLGASSGAITIGRLSYFCRSREATSFKQPHVLVSRDRERGGGGLRGQLALQFLDPLLELGHLRRLCNLLGGAWTGGQDVSIMSAYGGDITQSQSKPARVSKTTLPAELPQKHQSGGGQASRQGQSTLPRSGSRSPRHGHISWVAYRARRTSWASKQGRRSGRWMTHQARPSARAVQS